jgi:hypothetical protein
VKALGTFIVIVLFFAGAGIVGCNNVGTTWRPDLDPAISAPASSNPRGRPPRHCLHGGGPSESGRDPRAHAVVFRNHSVAGIGDRTHRFDEHGAHLPQPRAGVARDYFLQNAAMSRAVS